MKITKFKKLKNNQYELLLDNNESIVLYEDVIIKEELLLSKEIDNINTIITINDEYRIYDLALRYLNHHVMSIMGMKKYLRKKNIDDEMVEKTVDKLIEKGFLNDEYFTKCYINDHIRLSNDGPLKIKNNLLENGISDLSYLDTFNDEWYDRICKYIEKQVKINKKSIYFFKSKMLLNLINLGYERDMINSCLEKINMNNEKENRKKEEDRLRKRLSLKYSGDELERKIKEKLYQRGFFE